MKGEVELLARALIKSKGKLLVCKRIGRKYFFFPGGHIDSGEKAEEALKRELREELGIRIKKCSFIGKIENSYIEDGKRHREINLVFDVKPIKVTTKSRESHLQFFLFDKKQIKKENVLPLII